MDDIFAGQLMTADPETVDAATPVRAAADTMLSGGIGSLLVVDDEGRLEGVLTRTDFVRLAASEVTETTPVSEWMTEDVITTTPGTSIRAVADTMLDAEIHHLPVVDDDGVLVGVITTTDLAVYLSTLQTPSPA